MKNNGKNFRANAKYKNRGLFWWNSIKAKIIFDTVKDVIQDRHFYLVKESFVSENDFQRGSAKFYAEGVKGSNMRFL